MSYHEGELEMQRRAGVRSLADRVSRMISPEIPAAAAAFLAQQPFVVVASVDAAGATTASLVIGAARAADARTVVLAPRGGDLDRLRGGDLDRLRSGHLGRLRGGHLGRLRGDVAETGLVGLLAIDLATRRRMRVNGNAVLRGEEIVITTGEVYSNCPQYITPRPFAPSSLTAASTALIDTADTFFLATSHPARGADASHRGGPPGFVRRLSPTRLAWSDFPGNNMFNSLGNLAVNPRCGLLFIDFTTGAALQLRGRAEVIGDANREVVVELEPE